MIAGWRAEVRMVWPDLDDDAVLLPALLDAQLFWVWLTTWQFFTQPHAAQGHSTKLADTPPETHVLTDRWRRLADDALLAGADAVAEHAAAVGDRLRKRWFDDDPILAVYQAFRR